MQVADDLLAILFLVLATRYVNPEVKVVAGLDDGLVKVSERGQKLKPTVEDVLVRMGIVVLPFGVAVWGIWMSAVSPKVCWLAYTPPTLTLRALQR